MFQFEVLSEHSHAETNKCKQNAKHASQCPVQDLNQAPTDLQSVNFPEQNQEYCVCFPTISLRKQLGQSASMKVEQCEPTRIPFINGLYQWTQCCKHPDIIFLTSPKVSHFAELSGPLLDCCDLFCSEYLNLLLPLLSGDDLLPIGQSSVGLVIWTKAFSFAAFCLSASTSCNN